MKPQFWAGFFLGFLMLMPAAVSSRALPNSSQQASSAAKAGPKRFGVRKRNIPFPQVPRITAEEVQRLIKEKGNVVLVDTDDSESYGDEHIKGAVNIAYDPTADPRAQDETLSRASRKQVDCLLLQLPPRGG